MSNTDIDSKFKKEPQYLQQDIGQGCKKAIIVDVRDPHMNYAARVLIYSEHGDYKNLDIYALDWAEPLGGVTGSFNPPKLGDRVWVTYEEGEKYSLVYFGSWTATPMGDGTLPWNKRKGNEIPIEVRHHRDLYHESSMIKRSGNGNALWMNDLFLDKSHLASSINIMDSAGKYFRVKSFHSDLEQEYTPKDEFEEGEGQLYKGDIGEFKSVRKGYELPSEIDQLPGAIEFGVQRLSKKLVAGKEDFSVDITEQKSDDTKIDFDSIALAAKLCRTRLEAVSSQMMDGMMGLFAPSSVRIPNLLTCPERWDDEDSQQQDNGGDGVLA